MATAFTQQKRSLIRKRLEEAAMERAAAVGMRRTTVEELSRQVGISKGMFYSFFESKEQLFFEVLSSLHEEMYGGAERVLKREAGGSVRERMARAIYEALYVLEKRGLIAFVVCDVPALLGDMPPELVACRYRSDEERIRALLGRSGAKLSTDIETTCAAIRMLLFTLLNKRQIGEKYDMALQALVDGACRVLIS